MKHSVNCNFYSYWAIFFIMFIVVACQQPSISNSDQTLGAMLTESTAVAKSVGIKATNNDKIDGMTLVAPPKPFSSNPFLKLKEIDVNWIGIIPYAYTQQGKPSVAFGSYTWQWWGETVKGATQSIKQAHANDMLVMLKPQVYIPGSWPGGMDFDSEEDWQKWESDYEKYILTFAKIASEQNVALFCIGTEFKLSSINRPEYWEKLIIKIRKLYKGKLTYAANWDEYKHIAFWDKLDFIGVDAYFPLNSDAVPAVEELVSNWYPYEKEMKRIAASFDKPILFTEYGYMSVEGCAGKTWELEADRSILKYNEQAQANAFDAMYQVFYEQDFWAGGFVWKWYPDEFAGPQRMRKDYTPQNKMGEQALSKWYAK